MTTGMVLSSVCMWVPADMAAILVASCINYMEAAHTRPATGCLHCLPLCSPGLQGKADNTT